MTALALADVDVGPIPDYVEPVEAWRVWRVGMREGRVVLMSLFAGTVWEPAVPLAATCTQGHRPRWRPWRVEPNEHEAPDFDCRCGIYGVDSVAAARAYLESPALLYRDERVIGRVALWGSVVEGQRGWRGERSGWSGSTWPTCRRRPGPIAVRSRTTIGDCPARMGRSTRATC